MRETNRSTRKPYALSGYPLSAAFRARLEHSLGTVPTYLILSELRSIPIPQLIKKLRTLGASDIFLPLEDVNSGAILPILQAIAGISDAQQIFVLRADLQKEQVSRPRILLALWNVAHASLTGQLAARISRNQLSRLLRDSRTPCQPTSDTHVLYLNANLWFGVKAGGSVGHIAGVVNGFQELGLQVTYASAGGRIMIDPGVDYTQIAPPDHFGFPFELNYYQFNRLTIDQVRTMASDATFAFLYQRMSTANYSGVILSRQLGIPLVLEYNGSEAWIAKNWGRPLRYHDLAVMSEDVNLRHAHLVVTISDVLRDELLERGVASERIVTYPNCIDPKVFDPSLFSEDQRCELRHRYNIPSDATVLTFVGTFGQWHGVEVLAETIRQLAEQHDSWLRLHKVHFLIVGDGLKMPLVRDILSPSYCTPFYTLTGLVAQHDTPLHLAASDLLLSPHVPNSDGTRFFGSPTKLFEYMAMGKAIVASDLGQIGDVLHHSLRPEALPVTAPQPDEKRLAVLTKPGSVQELSDAVQFLVESHDWRLVLGKNARVEALANFTWGHHVTSILDRLVSLGLLRR